MKKLYAFGRTAVIASSIVAVCALSPVSVSAVVWNDPASVVEQWSNASTYPKVIDINFSDTSWPNTWGNFGSSMLCPEPADGVYVNASLSTPVVTSPEVMYPINFHNCTFATRESNNGLIEVQLRLLRANSTKDRVPANTMTGNNRAIPIILRIIYVMTMRVKSSMVRQDMCRCVVRPLLTVCRSTAG